MGAYTATGTEVDKLNFEETFDQHAKYGFGYEGLDVIFLNGFNALAYLDVIVEPKRCTGKCY